MVPLCFFLFHLVMEIVVGPPYGNRDVADLHELTPEAEKKYFDYSKRALWLRAVVLGGNEGMVSTALLMMGIEPFASERRDVILTCLTGLVAAALCVAVSECVSVYTQVDIMTFQMKRDVRMGRREPGERRPLMPSPTQVATAASATYLVGGLVPLLAAGLIRDDKVRAVVAVVATCSCMLVLGIVGAALGKAPIARSCARVILGGWTAIAIMFAKNKSFKILPASRHML